jgi:hypothetical protein
MEKAVYYENLKGNLIDGLLDYLLFPSNIILFLMHPGIYLRATFVPQIEKNQAWLLTRYVCVTLMGYWRK